MGYKISRDGLKPDPERIKCVVDMKPPGSAVELKRFLGAMSYYRRFISNFSRTASFLYRLSESEAKFKWDSQANEIF